VHERRRAPATAQQLSNGSRSNPQPARVVSCSVPSDSVSSPARKEERSARREQGHENRRAAPGQNQGYFVSSSVSIEAAAQFAPRTKSCPRGPRPVTPQTKTCLRGPRRAGRIDLNFTAPEHAFPAFSIRPRKALCR
jgi:hypothetical protein